MGSLQYGALKFRYLNSGDIQFVFITPRPERLDFFPPLDFLNGFFNRLRELPKNLFQLNQPLNHFLSAKRTQADNPIRLTIVYENDFQTYFEMDHATEVVKILILDSSIINPTGIVNSFRQKYKAIFFTTLPERCSVVDGSEIYFETVPELFELLTCHKEIVERAIYVSSGQNVSLEVRFDAPMSEVNEFKAFIPSQVNFFTLNQILGNYWSDKFDDAEIDFDEESKLALSKDPDDLSRYKILIDQLNQIDSLELACYDNIATEFPNFYDSKLSPLILISASNFPQHKKYFEAFEKDDPRLIMLVRAAQVEQHFNYATYFTSRKGIDGIESLKPIVTFHAAKSNYLDGVGYLHASFRFSPVIRFPFIGNRVKKELSFFRPDAITSRGLNSLELSISKFGKKVSESLVPRDFLNDLFGRNRQIVAISDLPLEWLSVDGSPLCMTHDVTRMPENPLGGLMAYYIANSNIKLTLHKDILERALLLFCVSPNDANYLEFLTFFSSIEKLASELKFKIFKCESIERAAELVAEYKPELLVFDCHGYYESNTLSSYLIINNQKLEGSQIVKHKISAPIVFLSACFTSPTYGYANGIANAFFEAGSIAVTGTYFPISISGGSLLYTRILRNLAYAAKVPVHRNWLEFISHQIRTSFTVNIFNEVVIKLNTLNIPESGKVEIRQSSYQALDGNEYLVAEFRLSPSSY